MYMLRKNSVYNSIYYNFQTHVQFLCRHLDQIGAKLIIKIWFHIFQTRPEGFWYYGAASAGCLYVGCLCENLGCRT